MEGSQLQGDAPHNGPPQAPEMGMDLLGPPVLSLSLHTSSPAQLISSG